MQRIFYRGDRHCHFMNWLVIIDALGNVVLSRPGFLRRTNDATVMRQVYMKINIIVTKCNGWCF